MIFSCPHCGQGLQVADNLIGTQVQCVYCQAVVTAEPWISADKASATHPRRREKSAFSTGFGIGCGIFAALVLGGCVLLFLADLPSLRRMSKAGPEPKFQIGATCRVVAGAPCYGAEDWWTQEEWLKAAAANDHTDLQDLVNRKRVVRFDGGEKILLLEGPRMESESWCYKVRVQEGNHTGKALIVLAADIMADGKIK
jgi:hypothetical protein